MTDKHRVSGTIKSTVGGFNLPGVTKENLLLETAETGQVLRATDNVGGFWTANGTQWRAINGEVLDVRDYVGARGDGVTDDRDALNTANTNVPTNGTIFFPGPHTYNVGSNLTFDDDVTLWFSPGAKINIADGVTVTIKGKILAGPHQIFSQQGTTGVVSFGSWASANKGMQVYPQWWGAEGDGSTNNTVAINAAILAVSNATGGEIFFTPGVYYCTGLIARNDVVLRGLSKESTKIVVSGGTANGFSSASASAELNHFMIKNIWLEAIPDSTGWGIEFDTSNTVRGLVLEDFWIAGFKKGIYVGQIVNANALRGRIIGQGMGVSGGIGIQIGGTGNRPATTTMLNNIYVQLMEKGIVVDRGMGVTLDGVICEDTFIALENHGLTIGSMYCENQASFSFTGGNGSAPVDGEIFTGATSGATGTYSHTLVLTSGSWAGSNAAGIIGLLYKKGNFIVGETVNGNIASHMVVNALGYSIKDLSDDAIFRGGVNITPLSVPSTYFSHISYPATGSGYSQSRFNYHSYYYPTRITSNFSIPNNTETTLIWNSADGGNWMDLDTTTGLVKILKPGFHRITLSLPLIPLPATSTWTIRIYKNTTKILERAVWNAAVSSPHVPFDVSNIYNFSPGDIIKVTVHHTDGETRNILRSTQYTRDGSCMAIENLQ